jgi:hypothetical protein
MFQLESPQDHALVYDLRLRNLGSERLRERLRVQNWKGVLVSRQVKLATHSLNPLKKYY